eukprot:scaffold79185_cov75-Cyclotella_meneghiniana.AAC.2
MCEIVPRRAAAPHLPAPAIAPPAPAILWRWTDEPPCSVFCHKTNKPTKIVGKFMPLTSNRSKSYVQGQHPSRPKRIRRIARRLFQELMVIGIAKEG